MTALFLSWEALGTLQIQFQMLSTWIHPQGGKIVFVAIFLANLAQKYLFLAILAILEKATQCAIDMCCLHSAM